MAESEGEVLLQVRDLVTAFDTDDGQVKAVDGAGFDVYKGRTLGIVGESGCGKSVTALSLMGLITGSSGRIENGAIDVNGRDIVPFSESEMCDIRGDEIAMIFQEPMTSLNPLHNIAKQVGESLVVHKKLDARAAHKRTLELLELVGLQDAENRLDAYPHELSGGQRQRVMIAMALANEPKLLIADEPTSSLDTTVRDQILKLLISLQSSAGLSLVILSHDLRLVSKHCDIVAVMYGGRLVEQGPSKSVFKHPRHPYTKALIESAPGLEVPDEMIPSIPGVPPILFETVRGCSYMDRCNWAVSKCRQERPTARQIDEQTVICHRAEQI